MIGVVLWTDADRESAVLWCEEHGELTLVDASQSQIEQAFDVGDVVRFEVKLTKDKRVARGVTHLLDNWGSALPDALASLPEEPSPMGQPAGAEVVSFDAVQSRGPRRALQALRRRTG